MLSESDQKARAARITMEWSGICMDVTTTDSATSTFFKRVKKNNKILQNVGGSVSSGQLLAIMGHSGCGKTSLLNVLAGRVSAAGSSSFKVTGSITINGKDRNEEDFRRISAYVLQDDALYPHLTVYETLYLAANFYLPMSVSDAEKERVVLDVITELGLIKVKDVIIGSEKVRGVSGGERKRANIATQLISDPLVLFLDEPTSGLDSFQALSVMQALKDMAARNGRLIVSVIHQPRSSIFELFDQLLLLSQGRLMYLGDAKSAVGHFHHTGFVCPKLLNPADYFLDVLSPDTRSPELEKTASERISILCDAWERHAQPVIEHDAAAEQLELVLRLRVDAAFDRRKFVRTLRLLAWRALVEQARDLPTLGVRLTFSTFFALLIGGIYSDTGYDQTAIQNRAGLLFIMCANQGFNGVLPVLNVFPKEKVIVNRERSARAYDTLSYFCAKYLVEMPLNVVPCTVFTCILYWIVGLNPNTFGYFLLIMMLEALTAVSLGLAVSALMPSLDSALAVGPPAMLIGVLFGGFYINVDSLPIVANWIPYLSFLKWTFQVKMIDFSIYDE